MELGDKLNDSVSEALMREMISHEHETDRSARLSVGRFASQSFGLIAMASLLFESLHFHLPNWLDFSGIVGPNPAGFEWLMLLPFATIALLLFRIHRNERVRSKLEARLTSAALAAIRRDLLGRS